MRTKINKDIKIHLSQTLIIFYSIYSQHVINTYITHSVYRHPEREDHQEMVSANGEQRTYRRSRELDPSGTSGYRCRPRRHGRWTIPCNILYYGSPNLSLITVISGLIMHYTL
jgi:hypothetical protein